MKSIFMQAMGRALEAANSNVQHAVYRMSQPLKERDDTVLGEYYFYVERKVSSVVHPYIREVFGEWMNFFEASISKDTVYPKELETLDNRVDPDALVNLLYGASVLPERDLLRTWINLMKELGYTIYSVDIHGKNDHIAAAIYVSNRDLVYVANVTINTK